MSSSLSSNLETLTPLPDALSRASISLRFGGDQSGPGREYFFLSSVLADESRWRTELAAK